MISLAPRNDAPQTHVQVLHFCWTKSQVKSYEPHLIFHNHSSPLLFPFVKRLFITTRVSVTWSYIYFLIVSLLPWIISLGSRDLFDAVDLIFMWKTQRSKFCDGVVYTEALGFFFLATPRSIWRSLFSDQESNPRPLQWKRRVLTTGPPGNSLLASYWLICFLCVSTDKLTPLSSNKILLCLVLFFFFCGEETYF